MIADKLSRQGQTIQKEWSLYPEVSRDMQPVAPTQSHLGQSGGEVAGLPMQQNDPDCTRVAQHALVLGPSDHVQSDPSVSAKPAQSGYSAIQPDPTQKSGKPESPCLAWEDLDPYAFPDQQPSQQSGGEVAGLLTSLFSKLFVT